MIHKLLEDVEGTIDKLPITKIKKTSTFFKKRLEEGRVYEDILIDNLEKSLGITIDEDEDNDNFSNDDGRFDFQIKHEDRYYTIECKGHPSSITYGNITLVIKEKNKYKPWVLTSDIYCGFYWENKELYSSYISVKEMKTILKSGVWDKYKKKGSIGWNGGECIYFHLPTRIFRESSDFTIKY